MFYILDDNKNVVEERDMRAAEEWLRNFENRCVGRDEIGGKRVSTVFLGLDHGFGGAPLFFEVAVFDGEDCQILRRLATWKEAEQAHREVCEELRRELC